LGEILKPWKIMKIKTGSLFLVLGLGLSTAIVAGITGCAADQDTSNLKHSPTATTPTWSGDSHTPPVYTSPATTPATTNLPSANTPP
jgi:hypothetical protein